MWASEHQPKKPSLVGECCTGWGMPNNQTMIIAAVHFLAQYIPITAGWAAFHTALPERHLALESF